MKKLRHCHPMYTRFTHASQSDRMDEKMIVVLYGQEEKYYTVSQKRPTFDLL